MVNIPLLSLCFSYVSQFFHMVPYVFPFFHRSLVKCWRFLLPVAPFALNFVPHSRSSGMLRVPSSAQEVIGELGMNMDEPTKSGNGREMMVKLVKLNYIVGNGKHGSIGNDGTKSIKDG